MALNVENLTAYVDETKSGLIKKAVVGAKSASIFNLMTGVKGTTALNLLQTDVVFGNGLACGWSEEEGSEQTFSQRNIVPGYVKVNMSFCDATLSQYWMNHEVKVAAGTEVLPFEEALITGITDDIVSKLEKAIWHGDILSTDDNLKHFDGLLKILDAASAVTIPATIEDEDNILTAFNAVYSVIPVEVLEKATLLCGSDTFRSLVMYLTEKNLYHYAPAVDGSMELILPGTSTKVIAVNGLNSTKKIIGTDLDNIFYGTDLTGDEEKFDFWYSQDNQEFRLAVKFISGVQVAYPDMIAIGTHN